MLQNPFVAALFGQSLAGQGTLLMHERDVSNPPKPPSPSHKVAEIMACIRRGSIL